MNSTEFKTQLLDQLYAQYKSCQGCHFGMPLATQIVLGEGNPDSRLLFIGEAPGRDEDLQGRPFVGRSGKLLNKLLEAHGASRSQIYITNIVKIRPPNNRKPTPSEIEAGKQLLLQQIKIIQPRIICTLGSSALEGILAEPVKISQMRGKPIRWHDAIVFPTYHPAYILRNPKQLKTLASDLDYALNVSNCNI